MVKVYPRVCGGTFVLQRKRHPRQGLSPRVRGNLHYHLNHRVVTGSIPACAGEPGRGGRGGRLMGVYPRVCGGTAQQRPDPAGGRGLSPRVRGNRG